MKSHLQTNTLTRKRGISLVEVMIGIAITTTVLLIMIRFFEQMSAEIAKGRAIIEMASQGRSVGETLRQDLSMVTVSPKTWTSDSTPSGYFTIVEGTATDSFRYNQDTTVNHFGDYDDILAATLRSKKRPFRGRFRGFNGTQYANSQQVIESDLCEVVWWSWFNDRIAPVNVMNTDDQLNVHRRALLIRPDIDLSGFPAANIDQVNRFFAFNDISARWVDLNGDGNPDTLVANSLEDLARRENRFGADLVFPYELTRNRLRALQLDDSIFTTNPLAIDPAVLPTTVGQDLVLPNVAAFDIRVWSPNAGVRTINNQIQAPGDPNYTTAAFVALGSSPDGAYVDLGFLGGDPDAATATNVWFAHNPYPPTFNKNVVWPGVTAGVSRTWCSWWPGYEKDGRDQDDGGSTVLANIDEGTDWLDSNTNGLVDDYAERETIPPYPYPIRGIQVNFRMIEKRTGQIQQINIESSFVPE